MNFKVPVFILLLAAVLTSCKKEDGAPPVLPAAQLNVVNVTADVFNVFQNGNRLNNVASIYPNGMTGYMSVTAGEQKFQFKRNGSPDVLFDLPLTLDSLGSYTLFAPGLSADEVFLVKDAFTADTGNVAMVRFINASPETTNLDIALRDTLDNITTIDNAAFKSVSAFIKVNSGPIEIKLLRAGTSAAIITDTLSLQSGQGYTIYAKGRFTVTGDNTFGAGIINN